MFTMFYVFLYPVAKYFIFGEREDGAEEGMSEEALLADFDSFFFSLA